MRFSPSISALIAPALLVMSAPAWGQDEASVASKPLPPVEVRLASLGAPTRISIRCAGEMRVVNPGTGIAAEVPNGELMAALSGAEVKAGDLKATRLRIEGELLTLQVGKVTRNYPDALILTAGKNGLAVTNACPLERYTEGVLAGECPALFHPEAIRAMAVAARSYSFRKGYLGGALCDTAHCQVYLGVGSVKPSIREAVTATNGLCALYEGEVIDAVYSADCGGYTEANENAWKGARPIPYLRPVEDAPEPQGEPFCAINRTHKWSLSLAKDRLIALFGKAEQVVKLAVVELSESGRVRRLQLAPEMKAAGAQMKSAAARLFSGDEWRRVMGLAKVRSLKFEVQETENGVQLSGRGYGHGVGLCQFGANGMGRQGYTYTDIIQHYYTGVTLAPAPSVEAARALVAQKRMAVRMKPTE
ncbi:MAG: SpoIID/LytB domain-containing protein [Actinomycetota bacterium]